MTVTHFLVLVQLKGEWKEAWHCCEDALALIPGEAEASMRMGMLYVEKDLSVDDKYAALVGCQLLNGFLVYSAIVASLVPALFVRLALATVTTLGRG